MDKRTIPFSPPDITEHEIDMVAKALRSGWITTGPQTKEFENRLAAFCSTARSVCLNSATAAEELNLRVLGVGPGDEIIVPAYTYTATASPVIHCGAKLIFVDSRKDGDPVTHSPEMDYEAVASAVNGHTKAIIAVDYAGLICDYDRILDIADSARSLFRPSGRVQEALGRVAVIADAAHSLGAVRRGMKSGEIADFSSFSFHAVKNLTTAEGGASTWRALHGIDDGELYRLYQLYSLHGQDKDALAKTGLGTWEYDVAGPWYKYNMTDVAAALGLGQLDRYAALLARRREIIARYDSVMDDIGIIHLNHSGTDYSGSGHLYPIRIPGIDESTRNHFIIQLAEHGISSNVHYKPLPMMTAYRNLGWDIADFPNAYDYYRNLITLPLHTKLSDDDVDYICRTVREAAAHFLKCAG